ncbi:chaperone protein EcpD [Cupriavidus sp. YR651]|uniref:fimbrial chaperone n=1 Tax=Cupriavidus sp. YR651 TaxID=1855315 RepID=UPI00088FED20|nr:fimbrial chaperone [Cupriavidus sp. YR651]SDD74852.1 chaperone protein EcpD [Cupriavidus sp. YR651]
MKPAIRNFLATSVLALGLAGALQAQASVVIGGTRVIYHAKESEVTIKLSNEGQSPALTQAWLDNGDAKATPSSVDVPFIVTPPVTRIDPRKGQTLRIHYTGEPLPQDKESVFWLNVLEVPPKPTGEAANANQLQLAFRSRIKFFYRPAGLKGMADDAPSQVTWRATQSGNHPAVEARNPTPYHVSFTALEVRSGGKTAKSDDGGMVGPGETKVFPLTGDAVQGADVKVHYRAINDYGGSTEGDATSGAAPQPK